MAGAEPLGGAGARGGVAHLALRLLGRLELVVASVAFIVTCAVVSLNALLRFGFNSSLVWSEEVALLCTNIFVFIGAAVILKAAADVSVTFVIERLSPRMAGVLAFLAHFAAVLFFAVLLWQALALWPLQKNTSTFILDISRYWFTAPLVWAAASMLATSALLAAEALMRLAGRGEPGFARTRLVTLPTEPE